MARKLCLQLLSHFLQSTLYFFLPRSSRKNAHSLLRYFGIRGIANTSFSLPVCRLAPKTRNAQNRFPLYVFGAILGVFVRYKRLFLRWGIPLLPDIQSRCMLHLSNKKVPYFYDTFILLGRYLIISPIRQLLGIRTYGSKIEQLMLNHHCKDNHILNYN